ncbi:MAG: MaoC/PaaZ C-terminal domain-containing protein [Nocardioidaceae bacterium]
MATHSVKSYRRAPSTLALMARAAVTGIPGLSSIPGIRRDGRGLPDLVVRRPDQPIDLGHLAAYNRLCGFGLQATVPVTYPHVLAFGLQLALLTDRRFPFPALGLVHVHNSITQLRPVQTSERLDLEVGAANLRPHPRGRQFDVVTTARVQGSVVWAELTTLLRRGSGHPTGQRDKPAPLPPSPVEWRLPVDLGRRYAAVSGDRNPIHLYAITARPFGFHRQIAQGMWSLARCLAGLAGRLPATYTVEAKFSKPILLPADVAYTTTMHDEVVRFALADAREGTPHVSGLVTPG